MSEYKAQGKGTKVRASTDEVSDGTLGGCVSCGELQNGCEPDARQYECESCGKRSVYGLEELLIMGLLELTDDEGEFDDE